MIQRDSILCKDQGQDYPADAFLKKKRKLGALLLSLNSTSISLILPDFLYNSLSQRKIGLQKFWGGQ